MYDSRIKPMTVCEREPRCSFGLAVPRVARRNQSGLAEMIVVVHGSERGSSRYLDLFVDFADRHGCYLLAPLFPVGLHGPDDTENYKFLSYEGVRYDEVLLAMVEQVARRYPVDASRWLLHGYSGGGHFAHRFLYAHPRRLKAVSIGAPGVVTLLDQDLPWWAGVADFASVFGAPVDIEALREVPVQMVIGALDAAADAVVISPQSPWYQAGIEQPGADRMERLHALRDSFESNGIPVRFDVIPGVGHQGWNPALIDRVQDFFAGVLQ